METITENLGWPWRMARLPEGVRTSLWTLNSLQAVMATEEEPSTGKADAPKHKAGISLGKSLFHVPSW